MQHIDTSHPRHQKYECKNSEQKESEKIRQKHTEALPTSNPNVRSNNVESVLQEAEGPRHQQTTTGLTTSNLPNNMRANVEPIWDYNNRRANAGLN